MSASVALALQTAESRLAAAAADLRSKVVGSLCPICGNARTPTE